MHFAAGEIFLLAIRIADLQAAVVVDIDGSSLLLLILLNDHDCLAQGHHPLPVVGQEQAILELLIVAQEAV